MTTESRAAFARRLGVNRSTVTRWAETGRVVLAGDAVEIAASLQKLKDTGGARPDVAERHAAGRAAAKVGAGDTPPVAPPRETTSGDSVGNSYQTARAVKEKYNALQAKLDYERQLGNLIPKEDVDLALATMGAAVRSRLDVLADQIAPIVAPVTDLNEVHALLSEQHRLVLAGIADDLQRQEAALGAA